MKDLDLLTHLYAAAILANGEIYHPHKSSLEVAREIAVKNSKEILKLEKEEIKERAKNHLIRPIRKDVDYSKFNLLYHITPMGNWEWNLQQLAKRIEIFGGHRVFTIATGKDLTAPDKVAGAIEKFTSPSVILGIPNDLEARETAAFLKGLEVISKLDRESYTFYAHTKGVTRGDNLAVKLWTAGLYHYNLDYIYLVMNTLKDYPVVGSFRRLGRFKGFPARSLWHYSGTFFWFRNKDLFGKPNWRDVPKTRYGTEAYLSLLFKQKEAGLLWWNKVGDLYDLNYIKNLYGPELPLVEAHAEL